MQGHCLLNHLNSCDYLSKCVCEKLKHELIRGRGGKSPPGFKCTHNFRNIVGVSGTFTSLCKVEKWSPVLKMHPVVHLAPCVCAWWVSLGEETLPFQPSSGCVWHRSIGQAGFLWLLFRGCICCSSRQAPCHYFYCYFSFLCSGALCSCRSLLEGSVWDTSLRVKCSLFVSVPSSEGCLCNPSKF